MGHYIEQINQNIMIKKENFEMMLKSINNIPEGRYRWVNHIIFNSIDEAFKEWRYKLKYDENGNIIAMIFTGEKYGDDGLFFEAIAPFVVDNSYIDFRGDDYNCWRWLFLENHVSFNRLEN